MLLRGSHRKWGKYEGNGSSSESVLKQLVVLTAHHKLFTLIADVTVAHATRGGSCFITSTHVEMAPKEGKGNRQPVGGIL